MYLAHDLAGYIVAKCIADKSPITNLHLQAVLYCIQREYLRERGRCAFPENIVAERFGPVVKTVFWEYCNFGAMPIFLSEDFESENIRAEDRKIIDGIAEAKRGLTLWDLRREIMPPGGAWEKAWEKGKGSVITTSAMRTESAP